MNKKGLTLIELLVVVSVIAIMSGILIFNSDDSGGTIDITNQVSSIKQDIYGSRERTLSGTGREQDDLYYGIGLYFDTSLTNGEYYLIYSNQNSDKKYDDGIDDVLDKVYLDHDLEYVLLNSYIQMIYFPPIAEAYFCDNSSCTSLGSLSLRVQKKTNTSKNATINVNSAGVIE